MDLRTRARPLGRESQARWPPDFGGSVSLDGDLALVSASFAGPPVAAGAAYLYQFNGVQWQQTASLTAFDKAQGDNFGDAVALNGGRLLVGASHDDDSGSDSGSIYAYDAWAESLVAFSDTISLAAGGVQHLGLAAGAEDAGKLYLLATTASGTCPGFFVGDVFVPANLDVFTAYSIAHANQPPFVKTFGILGASGSAGPAIHLPAGTTPALAGLVLNHSAVVLDPSTFAVRSASNSVSLELSP